MALEFAKLGCVVVGCDISNRGLVETRELVHQARAKFRGYICDLSNRVEIYKMADKVCD